MPNNVEAAHEAATDLLTVEQVINELLVDANLRRAAATCVLPAVRYGTTWRFKKADLDEWIRRQNGPQASAV